jgi:hypothetical protein
LCDATSIQENSFFDVHMKIKDANFWGRQKKNQLRLLPSHSGKKSFHVHFPGYRKCRIPDDSIQFSRWPLFFAREVLREVIDSQKSRKGGEDGTSSA